MLAAERTRGKLAKISYAHERDKYAVAIDFESIVQAFIAKNCVCCVRILWSVLQCRFYIYVLSMRHKV